jgi:hypothetical protein
MGLAQAISQRSGGIYEDGFSSHGQGFEDAEGIPEVAVRFIEFLASRVIAPHVIAVFSVGLALGTAEQFGKFHGFLESLLDWCAQNQRKSVVFVPADFEEVVAKAG